jgi:hypothetical protein
MPSFPKLGAKLKVALHAACWKTQRATPGALLLARQGRLQGMISAQIRANILSMKTDQTRTGLICAIGRFGRRLLPFAKFGQAGLMKGYREFDARKTPVAIITTICKNKTFRHSCGESLTKSCAKTNHFGCRPGISSTCSYHCSFHHKEHDCGKAWNLVHGIVYLRPWPRTPLAPRHRRNR